MRRAVQSQWTTSSLSRSGIPSGLCDVFHLGGHQFFSIIRKIDRGQFNGRPPVIKRRNVRHRYFRPFQPLKLSLDLVQRFERPFQCVDDPPHAVQRLKCGEARTLVEVRISFDQHLGSARCFRSKAHAGRPPVGRSILKTDQAVLLVEDSWDVNGITILRFNLLHHMLPPRTEEFSVAFGDYPGSNLG